MINNLREKVDNGVKPYSGNNTMLTGTYGYTLPIMFHVRSGFMSHLFEIFHVEVKRRIGENEKELSP